MLYKKKPGQGTSLTEDEPVDDSFGLAASSIHQGIHALKGKKAFKPSCSSAHQWFLQVNRWQILTA